MAANQGVKRCGANRGVTRCASNRGITRCAGGGPGTCLLTAYDDLSNWFWDTSTFTMRAAAVAYGACASAGDMCQTLYSDELSLLGVPFTNVGGAFFQKDMGGYYADPTCPASSCPGAGSTWYTNPSLRTGGLDSVTILFYAGADFLFLAPGLYALGWRCGWLITVLVTLCPDCPVTNTSPDSPTYVCAFWKLAGSGVSDVGGTYQSSTDLGSPYNEPYGTLTKYNSGSISVHT